MTPAQLAHINELAGYRAGVGASMKQTIEAQIKIIGELIRYEEDPNVLTSYQGFMTNSQTALSVMDMLDRYRQVVPSV